MEDEGKAVGCVPPTALLFEPELQSKNQGRHFILWKAPSFVGSSGFGR
jgi:hypothetical protein